MDTRITLVAVGFYAWPRPRRGLFSYHKSIPTVAFLYEPEENEGSWWQVHVPEKTDPAGFMPGVKPI